MAEIQQGGQEVTPAEVIDTGVVKLDNTDEDTAFKQSMETVFEGPDLKRLMEKGNIDEMKALFSDAFNTERSSHPVMVDVPDFAQSVGRTFEELLKAKYDQPPPQAQDVPVVPQPAQAPPEIPVNPPGEQGAPPEQQQMKIQKTPEEKAEKAEKAKQAKEAQEFRLKKQQEEIDRLRERSSEFAKTIDQLRGELLQLKGKEEQFHQTEEKLKVQAKQIEDQKTNLTRLVESEKQLTEQGKHSEALSQQIVSERKDFELKKQDFLGKIEQLKNQLKQNTAEKESVQKEIEKKVGGEKKITKEDVKQRIDETLDKVKQLESKIRNDEALVVEALEESSFTKALKKIGSITENIKQVIKELSPKRSKENEAIITKNSTKVKNDVTLDRLTDQGQKDFDKIAGDRPPLFPAVVELIPTNTWMFFPKDDNVKEPETDTDITGLKPSLTDTFSIYDIVNELESLEKYIDESGINVDERESIEKTKKRYQDSIDDLRSS